jgi:glutathione S-transferase
MQECEKHRISCAALDMSHLTLALTLSGLLITHFSLRARIRANVELESDTVLPRMKFYCLDGGMCPYAARTWITLIELGFPFEIEYMNPTNLKSDWYLKLNPKGKVPVLHNLVDNSVVYESSVCDEYLCDVADEVQQSESGGVKNMRPTTASGKAQMRLLNDHIDSNIGTAQYTFLMNKDPERDAELQTKLEAALLVLENQIKGNGGPFVMGSEFTLADAHILPFFLRLTVSLRHFKDYSLPSDAFPMLCRWFEECSKRPSAQATWKSDETIIGVYSKFVSSDYAFGGLNKNK